MLGVCSVKTAIEALDIQSEMQPFVPCRRTLFNW